MTLHQDDQNESDFYIKLKTVDMVLEGNRYSLHFVYAPHVNAMSPVS